MKKERKWDLTKFCKDQNEFEEKFAQVQKMYPEFAKFKGKLGDKKCLHQYLMLEEKLAQTLGQIFRWAHFNQETDITNTTHRNNVQRAQNLHAQISKTQAYYMPELLALKDEYFDELIADKNFADWRHTFCILKKQKQHVLTTEQEELLSMLSPIMSSFVQIYKSCKFADIKFGDVLDSKGKPHALTDTNFGVLMENPDRVLRQNVYDRFFERHENYFNTLATNLISQIQRNNIVSKIYKYNSVLEETLLYNDMTVDFYNTFIKKMQPLFTINKEYNTLKAELLKKQYKLDKVYQYDLGLAVGKKTGPYDFETGVDIVKKSLAVLGDEYIGVLQRAIDENWIDVYPSKHKFTGGFCGGAYRISPVILLNWENQLQDVYTLAHELGHAIRQVYCDNNNSRDDSDAPMFIEETFSTVNQTLMYRYLIDNEKDIDKKINYLCEYLDIMFTYVVGSVQDSMCEDDIYNRVANGKPVDKDIILKYANQTFAKTRADGVPKGHGSSRTITMFHYYSVPYYVWQYSCGMTNANMIVNKIQKDPSFVKKYIEFNKAGGMYPLDMLKLVDIDYSTDAPFDEIKKELVYRVNQLKELIAKK